MDLLTQEIRRKKIVVEVSRESVRKLLKKKKISLHRKQTWCLGKIDDDYKKNAMSVLTVYGKPYDEKNPVICLDEKPKQLLGHVNGPTQPSEGKPMREDSLYKRNGTRNIFIAVEPLKGFRIAKPTKRRTRTDFARFIADIDKQYPTAETLTIVLDNLNTHSYKSLYDTFDKQEAKRLADKIVFVYTPKHGSWLNMAEIELSAISRQCLNRRIPSMVVLRSELRKCIKMRNENMIKINWRFTCQDAQILFNKLEVEHA